MTGILSNNVVRGGIAVLAVGAVVYGLNTTGGDVDTTTNTANTENASTAVEGGTITPAVDIDTTTEGTTTEGATDATTTETTTETTVE